MNSKVDFSHPFYVRNNIKSLDQIPNCFYRVSVKGLVLDENKKFLLVKQKNDKWDLPGGGLEWGENH